MIDRRERNQAVKVRTGEEGKGENGGRSGNKCTKTKRKQGLRKVNTQ